MAFRTGNYCPVTALCRELLEGDVMIDKPTPMKEKSKPYDIQKAMDEVCAANEKLEQENSSLQNEVETLTTDRNGWADSYQELRAEMERLKEGLKRLEWTPSDEFCEYIAHDEDDLGLDDEHHRTCMGCGKHQCEGHKPDCWLSKLIGGEK